MDFDEVFAALRGEGGVIFLLLLAVVVFFRGGIVTGKAYEGTVNAYEKRIAHQEEQIKFWRDKAMQAIEAGERAINGRA